MARATLPHLVPAVVVAVAVSLAPGQSSYEQHLEIRTSSIPHAGNGLFTTAAIPRGAYLGAYTGEFITDEEYLRRLKADQWQYMMGLLDCAKSHTGDITTIDGIRGNVFTRMNYAPAEFQNVKFEKICEPPFVKIVALRDIAAGEELWVDYGPNYRYDFMKDEAVIAFFADLGASRTRRPPGRKPRPGTPPRHGVTPASTGSTSTPESWRRPDTATGWTPVSIRAPPAGRGGSTSRDGGRSGPPAAAASLDGWDDAPAVRAD